MPSKDFVCNQMNKEETCDFIYKRALDKRVVATRYGDGECLVMKSLPLWLCPNMNKGVGQLLLSSIKMPHQLVCINQLKPHNIEKQDLFFEAHHFFVKNSQRDCYGSVNWNVFDFIRGSEILFHFFSGKTLLVGGHSDKLAAALGDINPQIHCFLTDAKEAGNNFEQYLRELRDKVFGYDSVLFFCGPISKVLIPHLVEDTSANLIDIGSLSLGILEGATGKDFTKQWPMTWASQCDLKKLFQQLKDKVKEAVV